jgi:hypothetical protein
VQPGAEADRELAEIAECLSELRCADSGEPVVARIMRYEELFDAEPYRGTADLFVEWKGVRRPRAIRSERVGEIPVPARRSIRSVHGAPGFAIGAGPGIEPAGARGLRDGAQARLRDVAATVLAQLGVPAPAELTGRPIEGLVPAAAEAGDRA